MKAKIRVTRPTRRKRDMSGIRDEFRRQEGLRSGDTDIIVTIPQH